MREIVLLLVLFFSQKTIGATWKGEIPPFANDSKKWESLMQGFDEKQMPYGKLAAASRMLVFFTDLPSKELAYKTIIDLIDKGYPYSAKSFFVSGDMEVNEDSNFSNSYNFYKGLLAREKGMHKWADHYFGNVDREKFPKYVFHGALQAYQKKDIEGAEKALLKILSMDLPEKDLPLLRKSARTLGRLYFEREEYDKALDIYDSFLLKLNPITPSDWLEAAWTQYYLKHYDQALGLLYNLESNSAGNAINMEKYVLRALIYQGVCDTARLDQLLKSFENDFGGTVASLKKGAPYASLPKLAQIYYSGNVEFYNAQENIRQLQKEAGKLAQLKPELKPLGLYLYTSEVAMFRRKEGSYREKALSQVANHLVGLSESLKFLKFEGLRERFNPDAVFKEAPKVAQAGEKEPQQAAMELRWLQMGDYWRDERTDYRGVLQNKCNEEKK